MITAQNSNYHLGNGATKENTVTAEFVNSMLQQNEAAANSYLSSINLNKMRSTLATTNWSQHPAINGLAVAASIGSSNSSSHHQNSSTTTQLNHHNNHNYQLTNTSQAAAAAFAAGHNIESILSGSYNNVKIDDQKLDNNYSGILSTGKIANSTGCNLKQENNNNNASVISHQALLLGMCIYIFF